MRHIAVSVLSLLVVLPAFADARLPVVNVASAGISARAAFGEPIVQTHKTVEKASVNIADNSTKSVTEPVNTNAKVVARSAAPVVQTASAKNTSADAGGQIIAANDVLMPRRPSDDLWAKNTSASDVVPLRLPTPDEFSVIRSDAALPEESLNDSAPVTYAQTRTTSVAPVAAATAPLSELDAQIARLNELQRRADESVNTDFARVAVDKPALTERAPSAARRETRGVVARPSVARTASVEPVAKIAANTATHDDTDDVKLSQMVVPMDDMTDDVVVRAVKRAESPRIASVRDDMTKMSPSELRRAFRKTFLSENKHLSTFQIDDRFDVASDMTENAMGFTSARDLSEAGGIRPLEIKINFRNEDAALSRDNYNLLTEYAGIVLSNPTRAIQVSIPQSVTTDSDARKLAARRLAIVEQVLRDNGISEQRILPVLSQRDEEGLVLRMISLDQFETLTKRQRDVFGDTISKKTYRSMSW